MKSLVGSLLEAVASSRSGEPLLGGGIDAALVARALQGESIAFEVLVVKYQRRVAAAIRRLVRDDRITEELTQEVFLKVFLGMTSFRPDSDFAAWLFAIARNEARSYLRSAQNRQDDRPIEVPDVVGDDAGNDVGNAVVSGFAASPEEHAIANQLFERIDMEVAALPDLQRRALLMREVDGLDYKSIAAALGLPVNTIKSHVFRARDAIARRATPFLTATRNKRW